MMRLDELEGPIKWAKIGIEVKKSENILSTRGIYIIKCPSPLPHAPLEDKLIETWITGAGLFECDKLTLENSSLKYMVTSVRSYLDSFWIPSETVLYIGKASNSNTIGKRLNAFWHHELGRKGPHRGGHWLKTLSNLNDLDVFWYASLNPEDEEKNCLTKFAEKNLKNLIPFANLVDGYGKRKQTKLRRTVIR